MYRGRRNLLVRVTDGTGQVTLRFFHFNGMQRNLLTPGNMIRGFGDVRSGPSGLEIIHPEFSPAGHDETQSETDDRQQDHLAIISG